MPDESNHADQSCGGLSCDECNARTAALIAERDQLQAWKDSALALEREWDQQALAKMLGGAPGRSCRKIINEKVPLLIAERGQMVKAHALYACAGESLEDTLKRLRGAADKACEERDQANKLIVGLRCYEGPEVGRPSDQPATPESAAGYRPGLTQDEKQVLEHLAAAWNKFLSLGAGPADSTDDFRRAVHNAQRVIAARVARRINPEIWNG